MTYPSPSKFMKMYLLTYTNTYTFIYIYDCVCGKSIFMDYGGYKSGLSFISWNTPNTQSFTERSIEKYSNPKEKMKWWWNMRIFLISNISYRFMSMSLVLGWTSLIFLPSLTLFLSLSLCLYVCVFSHSNAHRLGTFGNYLQTCQWANDLCIRLIEKFETLTANPWSFDYNRTWAATTTTAEKEK